MKQSLTNLALRLLASNSFWQAVATVALSLADNASRGWKYQLLAAGFVLYKIFEDRLFPAPQAADHSSTKEGA